MMHRFVTCVAGACVVLGSASASVAGCGSGPTRPMDSTTVTPPGTWTDHRPLTVPRGEMAAAALDGLIYVAGGQAAGAPIIGSIEAYEPAADRWTTLPAMPGPRHHHGMAAVGGKIYVIGGYSTPTQEVVAAHVFEDDPTQRAWRPRVSMPRRVRRSPSLSSTARFTSSAARATAPRSTRTRSTTRPPMRGRRPHACLLPASISAVP